METKNRQPIVYCIVLNWNSLEYTRACIASLQKQSYRSFKIVVVDNCSSDGSAEILKKEYPEHFFLQSEKNGGYAWGNNIGIRLSMKQGADFVWILNPDVCVSRESLEKLINVMTDDLSVGIAGPRLCLRQENEIKYQDGAALDKPCGYRPIHKLVNDISCLSKENIYDVDYVIGCSMLLRVEMIKQIGFIREDFFMYREDVELCLRAQRMGWRTVICTASVDERELNQNPNFPYWFKRNNVLLARIEKKYLLAAILYSLGIEKIKSLSREREFRKAAEEFAGSLRPVLEGMTFKIKQLLINN